MFEQMLLPSGGTHQGRNTVMAFAGQLGVVAIAAVLMAYFDVLPLPFPQVAVPLVFSAPPPPPPPLAATRAPVQTATNKFVPRTSFVPRTFNVPTAPVTIPRQAAIVAEAAPALPDVTGAGELGGVLGGVPGGSLNGAFGGFAAPPAAAAAPTPATAPAAPTHIRVGEKWRQRVLRMRLCRYTPSSRGMPAFRGRSSSPPRLRRMALWRICM